jgi:hypothetical protein
MMQQINQNKPEIIDLEEKINREKADESIPPIQNQQVLNDDEVPYNSDEPENNNHASTINSYEWGFPEEDPYKVLLEIKLLEKYENKIVEEEERDKILDVITYLYERDKITSQEWNKIIKAELKSFHETVIRTIMSLSMEFIQKYPNITIDDAENMIIGLINKNEMKKKTKSNLNESSSSEDDDIIHRVIPSQILERRVRNERTIWHGG